jgi:hypothetical protein
LKIFQNEALDLPGGLLTSFGIKGEIFENVIFRDPFLGIFIKSTVIGMALKSLNNTRKGTDYLPYKFQTFTIFC